MDQFEYLMDKYPAITSLQLCCVLQRCDVYTGTTTTYLSQEGKSIPIPKHKSHIEVQIESEAFSPCDNFTVTLYFSSFKQSGFSIGAIETLIKNETAVIVTTDCYALCEGDITLYGPTIHVLDFKFEKELD